jgi:hypothetical protein
MKSVPIPGGALSFGRVEYLIGEGSELFAVLVGDLGEQELVALVIQAGPSTRARCLAIADKLYAQLSREQARLAGQRPDGMVEYARVMIEKCSAGSSGSLTRRMSIP